MPDLLLLDTEVVVADACHRVTAPGGYEWWYFDAQDRDTGTFVVAQFHAGFIFHPQYLRRFHQYQSAPTRHTPPLPAEYPCVHLAVYENGRPCARFIHQYDPNQFAASSSECRLTIGPNQLFPSGNALRLHAEGSDGLWADLTFEPRLAHPPSEKMFKSGNLKHPAHHCWVISNPLCEVGGEIRLPRGSTIRISGLGYHDHLYGTAPLGAGLRRWMWGRVLLENQAVSFQIAMSIQPGEMDQSHLFMADRAAIGAIGIPRIVWTADRFSGWGLPYPTGVDMGPTLILRKPRILDSSSFCLRLRYDAYVDGEATGAFCRIVYPYRLGWPLLGRFIERSIQRA
jgi:carotenoid 1,2-hydratase